MTAFLSPIQEIKDWWRDKCMRSRCAFEVAKSNACLILSFLLSLRFVPLRCVRFQRSSSTELLTQAATFDRSQETVLTDSFYSNLDDSETLSPMDGWD